MYLLIIYIPLISFFIISVFGYLLGRKNSIILVLLYIFLTLLISLIIFYEVCLCNCICEIVNASVKSVEEVAYVENGPGINLSCFD